MKAVLDVLVETSTPVKVEEERTIVNSDINSSGKSGDVAAIPDNIYTHPSSEVFFQVQENNTKLSIHRSDTITLTFKAI